MKSTALVVIAWIFNAATLLAQSPVYTPNGVAINGYDPIAYFQDNKPVAGNAEFSFEWNGAKWQFASAENLAKFKEHPEQFAPQYGGYCAFGASRGYLAQTDPQAFTILDNKLYLNYNLEVRTEWMKDVNNRISKANENWESKLKHKSK
jgi:YHS domain-containing protein